MQTEQYQLLKEKYESLTDAKERIDCLIELVFEIRNFDSEEANKFSDEIIEQSLAINYKLGLARGLNHKGAVLWLKAEYAEGLKTLKRALEIAKAIKEKQLEARIYNNLGNIYRDLGNLAEAFNFYQRALDINEKNNDELALSSVLINFSNLHFDLYEYDNALDYAFRCLKIFDDLPNDNRLISIYRSLGNIYFKKEDFENANEFYKKSFALAEENTVGQMLAFNSLGKVFYKQLKFVEARMYLLQALQLAENLANVEGEITAKYYLAKIHFDEGNLDNAEKHLQRAFELAKMHSRKHDVMSIHETFSQLYELKNNIPKAFEHLKMYERLKEEIFQENTINKLHHLQSRHQIEFAQKEKEVAERTAKLKQQFMANMSHEIRTPMNAIVGMTRLLAEKNPKPEQLKYLNAISQSADNLLVIINDILDFSKIEAGKVRIEQIDFSLKDCLKNVVNILRLKAEEKDLQLWFDLAIDVPEIVIGDSTRLNQILMNLAGNAVKFTEKGRVDIFVYIYEIKNEKAFVKFDVVDTGIGIAEEYVNKIFEGFTQAGTDTARKFGGTGLGLTISKQLLDLMQGTIEVKSKIGEGTTFSFIIPFAIPKEKKNLSRQEILYSNEDMELLNYAKILMAEDNEFNLILAEDTLKDIVPNIKLDIAKNGLQAIEKIQENEYDLVLMDIQMPVLNGLDATIRIRKELNDAKKNIKIIAITANVMQDDIERYLNNGMNDHVPKPFKKEMLIEKLLLHLDKNLLKKRKEMNPIDEEEKKVELDSKTDVKNIENKTYLNLDFLTSFTNGKKDKEEKYLKLFLDNAPKLLNQINNAATQNDFESITIAAHSLKSQLNYVGVKEEQSQVYKIEKMAREKKEIDLFAKDIKQLNWICEKVFAEINEVLI